MLTGWASGGAVQLKGWRSHCAATGSVGGWHRGASCKLGYKAELGRSARLLQLKQHTKWRSKVMHVNHSY